MHKITHPFKERVQHSGGTLTIRKIIFFACTFLCYNKIIGCDAGETYFSTEVKAQNLLSNQDESLSLNEEQQLIEKKDFLNHLGRRFYFSREFFHNISCHSITMQFIDAYGKISQCSGTTINPYVIITAAHCLNRIPFLFVNDPEKKKVPSIMEVTTGDYLTKDNHHSKEINEQFISKLPYQKIKVTLPTVYISKAYSDGVQSADIAIVKSVLPLYDAEFCPDLEFNFTNELFSGQGLFFDYTSGKNLNYHGGMRKEEFLKFRDMQKDPIIYPQYSDNKNIEHCDNQSWLYLSQSPKLATAVNITNVSGYFRSTEELINVESPHPLRPNNMLSGTGLFLKDKNGQYNLAGVLSDLQHNANDNNSVVTQYVDWAIINDQKPWIQDTLLLVQKPTLTDYFHYTLAISMLCTGLFVLYKIFYCCVNKKIYKRD